MCVSCVRAPVWRTIICWTSCFIYLCFCSNLSTTRRWKLNLLKVHSKTTSNSIQFNIGNYDLFYDFAFFHQHRQRTVFISLFPWISGWCGITLLLVCLPIKPNCLNWYFSTVGGEHFGACSITNLIHMYWRKPFASFSFGVFCSTITCSRGRQLSTHLCHKVLLNKTKQQKRY